MVAMTQAFLHGRVSLNVKLYSTPLSVILRLCNYNHQNKLYVQYLCWWAISLSVIPVTMEIQGVRLTMGKLFTSLAFLM